MAKQFNYPTAYKTRKFENSQTLLEMLELRKQGWNYSMLGRRYDCDHTSVMYQCVKYGVASGIVNLPRMSDLKLGRPLKRMVKFTISAIGSYPIEEPVVQKSYKEYLIDQRRLQLTKKFKDPKVADALIGTIHTKGRWSFREIAELPHAIINPTFS